MSAEKIRYKRAVHAQPQLPDGDCGQAVRAANHPSLIYPPGLSVDRGRQRGLVGHFLFSAKFICMGKQKNGLTATQPSGRRARLLRNWSWRLCAPTRVPHCTRTALSTALGSGAATITRPNLPCSGRPAHPPSCPKTSRQRLTTATYPAPHARHHLPCTSCLLSVVFRQRRSTCGRVVREFGMGRARERGRVGDGLRARWGW